VLAPGTGCTTRFFDVSNAQKFGFVWVSVRHPQSAESWYKWALEPYRNFALVYILLGLDIQVCYTKLQVARYNIGNHLLGDARATYYNGIGTRWANVDMPSTWGVLGHIVTVLLCFAFADEVN